MAQTTQKTCDDLRFQMSRFMLHLVIGHDEARAFLADVDALAAAQQEIERLRGAFFAVTKADDLDEAVMIARAALGKQS